MAATKRRLDSSRANKKHSKRSKKVVKKLTKERDNKLVELEDAGAKADQRIAVRNEYGKKIANASKPRGKATPVSIAKFEKLEDRANDNPTKKNVARLNAIKKAGKKRGWTDGAKDH